MKQKPLDEKYMRIAVSLAKKGIGETSPNPVVGAILVKNGKIIASAYHKKAGSMHAEALAIARAGKRARGAILYSTLEACTHYGKTPPCVDAIVKSGIKRAVFAMRDPNPVNYGRGIAALKRAGIKIKSGVLKKEALELNRPFAKFIKRRFPYVTIKMAQSVDGKIADAKGRSRWITSVASRGLVHKLRAQNDAVMIGVNTLLKDNPLLTSRIHNRNGKQPIRVILDTELRTALRSRLLEKGKGNGAEVLIAGGKGASPKKKILLEKKGAKVILLPRAENRVSLICLMKYLAKRGVMSVLSEGGSELTAALLKTGLADEAFFFISPRIIGGKTAPTSCGGTYSDIRKSIWLKDVRMERVGQDILIKGRI